MPGLKRRLIHREGVQAVARGDRSFPRSGVQTARQGRAPRFPFARLRVKMAGCCRSGFSIRLRWRAACPDILPRSSMRDIASCRSSHLRPTGPTAVRAAICAHDDHALPQELERYRQRVAVEASYELLRRHPEATRPTWLAAFAHLRGPPSLMTSATRRSETFGPAHRALHPDVARHHLSEPGHRRSDSSRQRRKPSCPPVPTCNTRGFRHSLGLARRHWPTTSGAIAGTNPLHRRFHATRRSY